MAKDIAVKGEFVKNLYDLPDEDVLALIKMLFRAYLTGEKQEYTGIGSFLYDSLYEYMIQDLERQEKRKRHAAKALSSRWEQARERASAGSDSRASSGKSQKVKKSHTPSPGSSDIQEYSDISGYTQIYRNTDKDEKALQDKEIHDIAPDKPDIREYSDIFRNTQIYRNTDTDEKALQDKEIHDIVPDKPDIQEYSDIFGDTQIYPNNKALQDKENSSASEGDSEGGAKKSSIYILNTNTPGNSLRDTRVTKGYEDKYIYTRVCDHLNEKTGARYRPDNKATVACIRERLKEGYTVDDFITVIDRKCADWSGTDMEKYLRPQTLFGNKFESYLHGPVPQKKPKDEDEDDMRSSRFGVIGIVV